MHYALAALVGDGSEQDTFRPPTDQGYSLLDLRAAGNRPDGVVVVATREREDDLGEYLGDTVDEPSTAMLAALRRALGLNLSPGMTLAEALGHILTVEAREDGSRVKPLRARPHFAGPDMPVDRFEVCLGGRRIWHRDVPVLAGAARVLSESFDKPASSTLGPDLQWVEDKGNWYTYGSFGRAYATGSWYMIARPDVLMDGNDHEGEVLTEIPQASDGFGGVVLRYDPNTDSYYRFETGHTSTNTQWWRVAKSINGTSTYIANETTGESQPPEVSVYGKVVGSTLTGWVDAEEWSPDRREYGPYTDTSLTTGRNVGVHFFGDGSTDTSRYVVTPRWADIQTNIDAGGSLRPTGRMLKTLPKAFTASMRPAGFFSSVRVVERLFTATMRVTGELQRAFTGVLGGTLAVSGSLSKTGRKVLGGAIEPAAHVVFWPVKFFGGTIAPAGESVLRFIGRIFGRPGVVASAITTPGKIRARFRMRG